MAENRKDKRNLTKRKGPNESTKSFDVGTIKPGNDGRDWIIKSFDGVKRWCLFDPSILKAASFSENEITKIDLDIIISKLRLGEPIFLGELNITTNKIGIGELRYEEFPARKGVYNIYRYLHSLIAIHDKYGETKKFKATDDFVGCDMGMFSFNDAGFPNMDFIIGNQPHQIRQNAHCKHYDAYYIYNSDIESGDPKAIFIGNGIGDGGFPIFKGSDAYLIMSLQLEELIFRLCAKVKE